MASFPGVTYGPLYYRDLEKTKSSALKVANSDFDEKMSLPLLAKNELQWWVNNMESAFKKLVQDVPSHQITTDASLLGWGAERSGVSSGGTWTEIEATNHIKFPRNACCVFRFANVRQG